MSQTLNYHVEGMHCKACEILLENELIKVDGVSQINADLSRNIVSVQTNKDVDPSLFGKSLTDLVKTHGYTLHLEKQTKTKNWDDLLTAFGIALIFGFGFLLMPYLGLANLITSDKVNYPLAFVIGLIASVSSCMAIVGGLLLSLSATWSEQQLESKSKKVKSTPHIIFHLSRLLSFFILGGVLGLIGTFFRLNYTISLILNLFIGLIMLILGLNLLDVFDWSKKLQFHLPKTLTKNIFNQDFDQKIAPIILGLLTFFLPCGFTQSMQIYSLSTGGFWQGGFTMLFFALGTLPVLAVISFSSFKFASTKYAGLFFKTAGFLVVGFAIYNLYASLITLGLIPVLF